MFLHGIDCWTKTFPTHCPTCRRSVFYFSCSCGSRVFFDELGGSWPQHDCTNEGSDVPKIFARRRGADGSLTVAVAEDGSVTVTRPAEQVYAFDPDALLRGTSSPPNSPEAIRRVPAVKGRQFSDVGLVRELIADVDLHARVGLPRTSLACAALGRLARTPVSQITVHVPGASQFESYTFFAPSAWTRALHKGTLVEVELETVTIPGRTTFWVCASLSVVRARWRPPSK